MTTWNDVEAKINFWDPSDTWGAGLAEFSQTEKDFITDTLQHFWEVSPTARNWLNVLADPGHIGLQIGKGAPLGAFLFTYVRYFEDTDVVMVNHTGTVVASQPAYQLLHEVLHIAMQRGDNQSPDISIQNQAIYDFWGPIVGEERKIAAEMGDLDQLPSAYRMRLNGTDAATELHWVLGQNYTDGQVIYLSRRGHEEDNLIDMRARDGLAGPSDDLMIGEGGRDELHGARGNDHIYGDRVDGSEDGNDTIYGGDGDDRMYGGGGDDTFYGGEGDDKIWGGLTTGPSGTSDGTDTADYSAVTESSIFIVSDGDGSTPILTVADGQFGIDTLHSIERIAGTTKEDSFSFIGDGSNPLVDLTDLVDDYALTSQNGVELRVKSIEKFAGGESLTTFVGKAGTPAEFHAGSGGGDFTLTAGDRAYGHDDVQDTYRVTTTVPAEFAAYTEAQKAAYLAVNRVFIGNFGAEDRVFVNGVLFNGNNVTSALAPVVSSDYNRDFPITYAVLAGDSSYVTSYAQASFDVRGQSWGGEDWGLYVYSAGRVRDVSFAQGDDDGVSLISFMSRAITPYEDGSETGYALDPLSSADEMLTIVIDGFGDGDGGISFSNDALANFDRPSPFAEEDEIYSYVHGSSWDPANQQIWVGEDYDLDGNEDGYLDAGGPAIDSDDPRYNFGDRPLGNDTDWEEYVLEVLNDDLSGTGGNDIIDGGAGNDTIRGGDGDDTLIGGDGNDALYGEGGEDLLIGNAGGDFLDGGDDADVMQGGAGDDIYRVDDAGDIVSENASEGSDTIVTLLVNYTLGAHVENLAYEGSSAFTGTGNALDNLIEGGSGSDTLTGGDGNDTLIGGDGNNMLHGEDGEDLLFGGDGDNWLDGGDDADDLRGGYGNDTFVYELGGGHDRMSDPWGTDVLELGAGITPANVTVTADGADYLLTLAGTSDSIRLEYAVLYPASAIEEVRFADSTVWTPQDLYDMAFGQSLMGGGGSAQALFWQPGEGLAMNSYMGDWHVHIP